MNWKVFWTAFWRSVAIVAFAFSLLLAFVLSVEYGAATLVAGLKAIIRAEPAAMFVLGASFWFWFWLSLADPMAARRFSAWVASWVLWAVGHGISKPMERCDAFAWLYPYYSDLMKWSGKAQDWAQGEGRLWPWGPTADKSHVEEEARRSQMEDRDLVHTDETPAGEWEASNVWHGDELKWTLNIVSVDGKVRLRAFLPGEWYGEDADRKVTALAARLRLAIDSPALARASGSEAAQDDSTALEVWDMWLCGSESCVLRPGQAYRFIADPSCEHCRVLLDKAREAYEPVIKLSDPFEVGRTNEMRAHFEQWCSSKGYDVEKVDAHSYREMATQRAWVVWRYQEFRHFMKRQPGLPELLRRLGGVPDASGKP